MPVIIDITGRKYGLLTVLFFWQGGHNSLWKCQCECGKVIIAAAPNLKSGNTSTCGDKILHQANTNFIDITGKRYGRLKVLSLYSKASVDNVTRTNWNCVCDCGNFCTVESHNLKSGHTQSCGCYLQERITKHGCAKRSKRLYGIWRGLFDRCYNPKCKSYKHYGAKGITVCKEWHNINTFFDWAFSHGYTDDIPDLSIERKRVYGNYEPDNCEWIPLKFQNQNTTKSIGKDNVIEIRRLLKDGMLPKEVADKFGISYRAVISIKNYDNWKEFKT